MYILFVFIKLGQILMPFMKPFIFDYVVDLLKLFVSHNYPVSLGYCKKKLCEKLSFLMLACLLTNKE